MEMISFGAGVNSGAMTVDLVENGWRGLIAMADPGAEDPDTYCWMQYFDRMYLRPRHLILEVISPKTHPDLYHPSYRMSLIEKCQEKGIVPIMANRWCTAEYKRVPLTRFARKMGVTVQLLGIAAEEAQRAKISEREGISLEYPLIDRGIDRERCKQIIKSVGLEVPPKSGCWFCPFQRLSEWRRLYDMRPDLFQLAVEMDNIAVAKMKARRANPFKGQLTQKFGRTLSSIEEQWTRQLELPGMPEPEYEHQMCECRL